MQTESYSVASNPLLGREQALPLHVLFSGESQTKPGHRLGPKVYDFYLMHIVLSGKGSFTLEGVRHELESGHTFLIKPEQLISYESDGSMPWRYRWVAFKGDQAAELADEAGFGANGQMIRLNDMRRAALMYSRIYCSLRNGGSAASVQSAGYLHLLMAAYMNELSFGASPELSGRSANDQLHQRVVHYLSTQFTHPVSIEHMSESLGYNRAYLSRIFKQRTGMSPITFLLKLRLDKAKLMLRERPELTVEQIAASVGLQDALYFSKQFRRLHGQSPTSYRKEILGD